MTAAASPEAAADVLAWAARHAGLHFPETRAEELRATVSRALAASAAATAADYLHLLHTDRPTRDALITALTVGETFFFRDTGQLEVIRSRIVPELIARRPAGVRAWSAGCATGEEAYTLAILLLEANALGREKVLGTDVSWHRLQRARTASYRTWSLRGIGPDRIARYFHGSGAHYKLRDALRERVQFRRHNLLQEDGDWPAGMDLIVCRNVLIYIDRVSIGRIVDGLLRALAPNGWLVLGAADPPLKTAPEYETIVTEAGLVYRRRSAGVSLPVPAAETTLAEQAHDRAPRPFVAPVSSESRQAGRSEARRRAVESTADEAEDGAAADLDAALAHVYDLADRGVLRGAIAACDTALARWGARADMLGTKAFLLVAAGDAESGADAARGALYLDPKLAVAHMALGEACAMTGATEAAARAFRNAERLLADVPNDATVTGAREASAGSLTALARLRLQQLTEVQK